MCTHTCTCKCIYVHMYISRMSQSNSIPEGLHITVGNTHTYFSIFSALFCNIPLSPGQGSWPLLNPWRALAVLTLGIPREGTSPSRRNLTGRLFWILMTLTTLSRSIWGSPGMKHCLSLEQGRGEEEEGRRRGRGGEEKGRSESKVCRKGVIPIHLSGATITPQWCYHYTSVKLQWCYQCTSVVLPIQSQRCYHYTSVIIMVLKPYQYISPVLKMA